MNLEQRIARALEDGLTDEEFGTLNAEADAEPTFRDARPLPSAPAPLPLDHDGRGPRVGTRREGNGPLMTVFARPVQTAADCHRLLVATHARLTELDPDYPVIARASNRELFAIDEILAAR